MRVLLFSLFCIYSSFLVAQKTGKGLQLNASNSYITFNPLSIAEIQSALGVGAELPININAACFTEVSAIFKNPFYKNPDDIKIGYRIITQFRFYFNQHSRVKYFIAPEIRLKHYSFSNVRSFINKASNDTLKNFKHTAVATSVGGGIVFGVIFPVSKNEKWQVELTAGIGGKHKFVKYKNINIFYKPQFIEGGFGLAPPDIDEAVGMPYLPLALRIRYLLP